MDNYGTHKVSKVRGWLDGPVDLADSRRVVDTAIHTNQCIPEA